MKDAFDYQAPTPKSIENITAIRLTCKDLRDKIIQLIPESRERSLAITKLEEVSMWANKAIVFKQDENV